MTLLHPHQHRQGHAVAYGTLRDYRVTTCRCGTPRTDPCPKCLNERTDRTLEYERAGLSFAAALNCALRDEQLAKKQGHTLRVYAQQHPAL